MNKIEHIVAENISHYRKRKGLTQSQLGELCSVEYGTIQRWEKAKTWPKPEHVESICHALNINHDALYSDREKFTQNLPSIFSFLSDNSDWIEELITLPSDELDMLKDMTKASLKAIEEQEHKDSSQA